MKNLKRALLGTTCLTMVGALPVAASIVNESTDFANAFVNATPLPGGADTVNGSLDCCTNTDIADFFTFQNLTAGDYLFTLSTGIHDYDGSSADIYLPGSLTPDFRGISNASQLIHLGEIGNVSVGVHLDGESATYSATLTSQAAATPEPSTLLLGAAGLAGALAWRRRRPI